ncbi:MAG TPA: DUF4215 domain-containing protein, partial [Candidatus Nanoarchaeia archaeon]|nr:DUF4215 domain-containing protein [Candidatus Nanoarchaeia archaeon]
MVNSISKLSLLVFLLIVTLFSVSAASVNYYRNEFFNSGINAKAIFMNDIGENNALDKIISPSSSASSNLDIPSSPSAQSSSSSDSGEKHGSWAIWVTRNACGIQGLDATIFNSGENVYINGENIDQGPYSWQIEGQQGESCDSGQIVASGTVSVGYLKKFCFKAYTVNENDGGQYNIKIGGIKRDEYRVDKSCTTISCGNGIVEGDEECDDGNTNNTDLCSNACKIIACHNNLECGANFNSSNFCIGNNVTQNQTTIICHYPGQANSYCSNSTINVINETCSNECNNGICTKSVCGNGITQSGEECDYGLDNGEMCVPSYEGFCFWCTSQCDYEEENGPECGDGQVNVPYEQCDDGNNVNDDQCSNECLINPYCGDGLLNQDWEECDDGNLVDGDGCDAECFVEGCNKNSDCGTDFYSNNYCIDDSVAINKTIFICNNPSSVNAYCSNYTATNVTGKCEYGCSDGICDECVPTTCQTLGKICGEWSNGCGGVLNCGPSVTSCSSQFGTCDVNGTKSCNVNGTGYGSCNAADPRPSNCEGLECGSNLCGGSCGACYNNETCEQGMCIPNAYCGDGELDSGEE